MITNSGDVDELSVSFSCKGISVGEWEMWIDHDEPGEDTGDMLELWTMIADLRAKIISLYGPNGSKREHLVWPD